MKRSIVILLTVLALASTASAASKTAQNSGNWNSWLTWFGSAPVAGDTVTINSGVTLTINTANASCSSLSIGSGSGTATLRFATSGNPKLTVANNITVGNSGAANRVGAITFTSGSTLICGKDVIHGTTGNQASVIDMTAGGTFIIGDDLTVSSTGAIWTPGLGTVELKGTNSFPAIYSSFNNLTINGSYTNVGTLTVGGALTGTGRLTQRSNAALNIGSTSTITSLIATANPNTVNYTGAAQTVKPIVYNNLGLSGSGKKTLTGVSTINGNLTTAGTVTATNEANFVIGGNLTVGYGTIMMMGGFNFTVNGNTAIDNTGILGCQNAGGNKTFNGDVAINSG